MMRLIIVGLMLLTLSACQPQAQDVKETRFLLGTIVEFTVYTEQEEQALKAIAEAAKVIQQVEDTFTTFGDIENSVKRFNRAKVGQVVSLDDEVEKLLLQSIRIHDQTMGAFDPTLGALNQLWGFSGDSLNKQPPSASQIKQALMQSGVQNIQQQTDGWIKKVEGLQLDFGAIAKGYAIDKAVEVFKKHGLSQAIINAGGDMAVLGAHGEKPWRIAIRHPRQEEPLGWLEVNSDMNIVTSGDYERFYMYQGERFHHILNPESGMPAKQSESVTIIAESATQADALSTAFFVLGAEQGQIRLGEDSAIQALWVTNTDKVSITKTIQKHFYFSAKSHTVH